MTRPSNLERCKNCREKFVPQIDVELLTIFNTADKSHWNETACPGCGFHYRIARLSRRSFEVCLIPEDKLPERESRILGEIADE